MFGTVQLTAIPAARPRWTDGRRDGKLWAMSETVMTIEDAAAHLPELVERVHTHRQVALILRAGRWCGLFPFPRRVKSAKICSRSCAAGNASIQIPMSTWRKKSKKADEPSNHHAIHGTDSGFLYPGCVRAAAFRLGTTARRLVPACDCGSDGRRVVDWRRAGGYFATSRSARVICREHLRPYGASSGLTQGSGTSSCRQIRCAVKSGISRCRGTDVRRPLAGFSQIEWSLPSRTKRQP